MIVKYIISKTIKGESPFTFLEPYFNRKYLPVLKKMPTQYIYEPWIAPRSVQEKAGCLVGTDYPRPIVVHSDVMKRNMARMKQARATKYGDKSNANTTKEAMTDKKKEGKLIKF